MTSLRFTSVAAIALAATLHASRALAVTPPLASATVTALQTGPSTYHYSLTLSDDPSSTTPVGTFWYAWLPGEDFMGTSPTNITSPVGWTSLITGGGANNGFAIQWKAASAPADLSAGSSLTGFSYDSTDTPAVEFGNSPFYSTPTLTSVAYSGAPFSDAGTTFVAAVPEPAIAGAVLAAAALLRRRRTPHPA